MAFTLNQHGTINNAGSVITLGITLTGVLAGDLITVELGVNPAPTGVTVSDNVNTGNYYGAVPMSATNGTLPTSIGIFSFINSKSGTITITANWTGAAAATISAQSWTPGAGNTVYVDYPMVEQNVSNLFRTTNPNAGASQTPASNADLVIGYMVSQVHVPTAGTNYTLIDTDATFLTWPEYWIQTSATATNTPYTQVSDFWVCQMAGFSLFSSIYFIGHA